MYGAINEVRENENSVTPNQIEKYQQNVSIGAFHEPPFIMVANGTVNDGIYYIFFKEVFKNWSIHYEIYKPLDWTLMEKDIANGSINLIAHPRVLQICGAKHFSCSQVIATIDLTILVPKSVLWDDMFFAFLPLLNIYHFLLIYFIIKFGLKFIISKWEKFNNNRVNNMGSLVEMLLAVLFTTYYCAFLSSYLTSPLVQKEIRTVDDVHKYGLVFESPPNPSKTQQQNHYNYFSGLHFSQFSRGYSFNNERRIKMIEDFKYFTFVSTWSENGLALFYTGNMSLHVLERLAIAPNKFIQRRHQIFLVNKNKANVFVQKTLNDYILNILQFGIFDYWIMNKAAMRREYRHLIEIFFTPYNVKVEDQVISISKLQGAFFLLLASYILGAIILICEILTSRFRKT